MAHIDASWFFLWPFGFLKGLYEKTKRCRTYPPELQGPWHWSERAVLACSLLGLGAIAAVVLLSVYIGLVLFWPHFAEKISFPVAGWTSLCMMVVNLGLLYLTTQASLVLASQYGSEDGEA